MHVVKYIYYNFNDEWLIDLFTCPAHVEVVKDICTISILLCKIEENDVCFGFNIQYYSFLVWVNCDQ